MFSVASMVLKAARRDVLDPINASPSTSAVNNMRPLDDDLAALIGFASESALWGMLPLLPFPLVRTEGFLFRSQASIRSCSSSR